MTSVVTLLCAAVSLSNAASLYGSDGGYAGYASYVPFKNQFRDAISRTNLHSEDSIHASAGSPEISRRPVKEHIQVPYTDNILPKTDEALNYKPSNLHGYGNNVGQEIPSAPYAKATFYGQGSGGYKIADAYQNQHIDHIADRDHDYKDDYLSYPQPYEYGFALKDDHGNTQHKKETSDGHGKVEGTYGFTDEHGLYRSVQYVADKEGFRASVKTNEPGTDSQDPADVQIESEQAKYL